MMKMAIIFAIIALTASVYYLATGFQKESAKFMKFFIYSFILEELITVFSNFITFISLSTLNTDYVFAIPCILVFLALNILLLKQDLGKKKSLIISYGCFALYLAMIIRTVIFESGTPGFFIILFRWMANVSLSLVLVIMQQLKYYDKKQRNTK